MTPMSPVPPAQIISAMSLLNSALAAKQLPPVYSSNEMAKLLAIQSPTTLAMQILDSGKLELVEEVPTAGKLLQQPITTNTIQQKIKQSMLGTLLEPANKSASDPSTGIQWLKLGVSKVGALILLMQDKSLALPSSNNEQTSLANMLTNSNQRKTIPVTLYPDGKVEVNIPKLNAPDIRLSGSSAETLAQAKSGTSTTFQNYLPTTPSQQPTATSYQNQITASINKLLQPINPNIKNALKQLSTKLASLPLSSNKTTQLFREIQCIQKQVAHLSPSIQNQLLPPKLLSILNAIPVTLTYSKQAVYSQLAEAVELAVTPLKPNSLILGTQEVLAIAQKMKPNTDLIASALNLLLKGLPSYDSKPLSIERSRAAVAQWIAQEAIGQIARLAQQQTTQLARHIDSPEQTHIQQEIPLKFGDDLVSLHIRIEEEQEHHDSSHQPKPNDEQNKKWVVFLSFDLPKNNLNNTAEQTQYEQLSVKINLYQQRISIEFWGETYGIKNQVELGLNSLQNALQESGFEVQSMCCHQGVAPSKRNSVSQTRVDITT